MLFSSHFLTLKAGNVEKFRFIIDECISLTLQVFADGAGTRVIFIDDKADGFVYNPVNDHCVDIPNLSAASQVVNASGNR